MSDDEFEQFWKIYPRRVAKAEARKAWKQVEKLRPPIADLLKSVYAARASRDWQRDDGQYIPYPSSWLRGERWDDQHEVNLADLNSSTGKVCAYCGRESVGAVNGIHYCRNDFDRARSMEKTNVVQIGNKPLETIKDKKLESCGS